MFQNTKRGNNHSDAIPGMFRIEFLYENKPEVDFISIMRGIEYKTGKIDIVSNTEVMVSIAFTKYTQEWSERQNIPIQLIFLNAEEDFNISNYGNEVQQTWDWPEKVDVLSKCNKRIIITDFMARELETHKKIELFNFVIEEFITRTNCDALFTPLSMCFRDPKKFLEYKKNNGKNYGFFNIRFFNIQNSDGDMIMDSIGLFDFELPDVQCHFRNLDPSEVATSMYNITNYILENGDIIEDGNTIQGISENDKWICQHEDSLIEPKRVVIDVNPGEIFSAGERRKKS